MILQLKTVTIGGDLNVTGGKLTVAGAKELAFKGNILFCGAALTVIITDGIFKTIGTLSVISGTSFNFGKLCVNTFPVGH